MRSSELIRKIGYNLNPRPEPDSLGRRPATPKEIEEAMRGGSLPERGNVYERPQTRTNHRR